jgi:predicted amidohydrolase
VAPYSDDSGSPLVTFTELKDRLHPGDILVWAHHGGDENNLAEHPAGVGTPRTGGHTQTIVEIHRGRVSYEPNVPRGAIFRVFLPTVGT